MLADNDPRACPVCHGAGGLKNPETQQWEDCQACLAEGIMFDDDEEGY